MTNEDKPLTDKQEKFCQLYVEHYNGTKAYLEAYPGTKSKSTARANASRLIANDNIKDYIEEIKTDFSKLCGVTVLRQVTALQEIIDNEETSTMSKIAALKEQSKLLGLYPTEQADKYQMVEQPLFGNGDE